MHTKDDRADRAHMEDAARTAIELRGGRTLTDAEWAAMRARLLEFVSILRMWDRKTTLADRGSV